MEMNNNYVYSSRIGMIESETKKKSLLSASEKSPKTMNALFASKARIKFFSNLFKGFFFSS